MQMYIFMHLYTAFIKYVMCAAIQSCSGLAVLVSNHRRNPGQLRTVYNAFCIDPLGLPVGQSTLKRLMSRLRNVDTERPYH